jgi:isopentenyl-diphosphate delta-isomerase
MLLQQRAAQKYHGGLLWTNACCSHPYPGEEVETAAHRRLEEELGFDTELEKAFHFTYKASVENGLTEHEYDHVFIGIYNGQVFPVKEEVADYCYQELEEIKKGLSEHPGKFTAWFRLAFPRVEAWWKEVEARKNCVV